MRLLFCFSPGQVSFSPPRPISRSGRLFVLVFSLLTDPEKTGSGIDMEKKDFHGWHEVKTRIEEQLRIPFFHEREIWWCSIGLNVGREEDGKNELFHRPVLVLKKFGSELFWALPITSKKKSGIFYETVVVQCKEQTALLSQLRILSSKRLLRRIGKMGGLEYGLLVRAVKRLL